MGACCCCYSREDHDYSYQSSRCCCRGCCFPSCLGCCCDVFGHRREEDNALSSVQRISSSASAGLLVGSSIETPIPEVYQAPPMPLPYERAGTRCNKNGDSPAHRESSPQGTEALTEFENPNICSPKSHMKDEKCKSPEVIAIEEEDVCPTCLEEYDDENPRILTKCEHHFHLACILEWLERSDSCPMCYQEVIVDELL
eukprot:TRINITY_DN12301_c0_g2_i1.p1 TRINITY_DN12301_c0_g2~~TRINITY_DN12301_c0_g2_i1.p1  ORF type:complete len:199 (+),score=33.82 TRINITY_DN12301_c0_g2_i1:255-851(+)